MAGFGFGGGGGAPGGAPRPIAAVVPSQTGVIYTLPRLLGSTSTLALLDAAAAALRGLSAGTNANLSLTGGNKISATAAIAAGASQSAAIEERSADGSAAVSRMVTLTGQISVPGAPDVNTRPPTIVAVGDSIVGGSSPNYYGFINQMPASGAWIGQNKGRPGTYSSVSLTNFTADALGTTYPADIVLICDGTNDRGGSLLTISSGTADGNPGKGVYNVRQMVAAALAAGKKVQLCSINHQANGGAYTNTNFMSDTWLADVTNPAGAFYADYQAGKIIYTDFRPVMSDLATGVALDATNYADNTHPSDRGGRIMRDKALADLVAAGWVSGLTYPQTRNQSVGDVRNIMGAARGTFQGTVSGAGVAQGWTFFNNTDGLVTCSVIAAPSGVGNAQRLTINPGAASFATLQYDFACSAYQGRKVRVSFRTTGAGMVTAGAKVQPKLTVTGNGNLYPTNGAGTVLGAAKLDSEMMHAMEFNVPAGATSIKVQLISNGNLGATAATIDIYDVLITDLG